MGTSQRIESITSRFARAAVAGNHPDIEESTFESSGRAIYRKHARGGEIIPKTSGARGTSVEAECLLRVKLGHSAISAGCPDCPRRRTSDVRINEYTP